MRVFVTGGNGFIGSLLLPALDVAGHKVTVLVRNPARARAYFERFAPAQKSGQPARGWWQRLGIVHWDPENGVMAAQALQEADAVIHLAGESIGTGRWSAARKQRLHDSRVVTTKHLAESLPPGVRHFLSASAVGIYPNPPKQADLTAASLLASESKTTSATVGQGGEQLDFLQRLCMDWEGAAQLAEHSQRRVVRMRLGIVLGNGGYLQEILPLYRAGLGGPIGDGQLFIPWIHIADVVAAFLWILDHEELSGAINVVGPRPVTCQELSAALAHALHRPHFLRVPTFAVRLALGEKAALALASCAALPVALTASGFRFKHTECSAAIEDVLQRD